MHPWSRAARLSTRHRGRPKPKSSSRHRAMTDRHAAPAALVSHLSFTPIFPPAPVLLEQVSGSALLAMMATPALAFATGTTGKKRPQAELTPETSYEGVKAWMRSVLQVKQNSS